NGIVHRDIKPHNVVVAPDGRLKVTDFGIARSGSSQMTEAGSIIGTAQYLSPEQAQGKPVDPSSDLYSVGVVLYEMLTGTVPFTGDTALEIAMKHLNTAPEPPSKQRPPELQEVPHELDLVVLRALAKDPEDRYRTAREMNADLERVKKGMPVAHETEEAATMVLSGAAVEAATQVVPAASRGAAGARVPPPYGRTRYMDYDGPAPRRAIWPWLLAALLLGLAGVAGYFVYKEVDHRLSATSTVQVPYVSGITEQLAVQKIQGAGLHATVVRRPNEKVAIGTVFDQNPSGGDQVKKGDDVVLTVSTGKPKVEVPDVRKDSLADAVHALTAAGLDYKEFDVNSSQPPGTVTGQAPGPGTMVVKGTQVRINVSKGLPPVIVPSDLIGKSQADATAELQQLGFNVATQPTDSTKPKGSVVDTNPKPGSSVQRGSQVTLLTSKGPQTAFVPNVLGFSAALAVQTVRAAGFKPVVQQQDTSDQAQDGIVLSESPEQSTQVTLGSPVTIFVGHYVPSGPTGATGGSGATGATGATPAP
ncbi:MAG TPA: PASTA domain-containing protein, partial [Gaiellaceae bacterium]|nr:PASTA domain-containing protein [Gaiellaceae bacterium]